MQSHASLHPAVPSLCLHPSSPVLEHRIAKNPRPYPQKKKINTSPGNKVEEDGKIPTSNQRDERKLWPLVNPILHFFGGGGGH